MFDEFTNFVRDLYDSEGFIPLHEPTLAEKEKKYLIDVVNSSFVSSIGKSVTEFEKKNFSLYRNKTCSSGREWNFRTTSCSKNFKC